MKQSEQVSIPYRNATTISGSLYCLVQPNTDILKNRWEEKNVLFYTYTTLGVPIKCTDLTEWLLPMAPSLSYQNQEHPNSYELGRKKNLSHIALHKKQNGSKSTANTSPVIFTGEGKWQVTSFHSFPAFNQVYRMGKLMHKHKTSLSCSPTESSTFIHKVHNSIVQHLYKEPIKKKSTF